MFHRFQTLSYYYGMHRPRVILSTYFKVIAFDLTKSKYFNHRLRFSRVGRLAPITHISLSYQTAMEESRQLRLSLRFEGKFSEKSYKVVGVTESPKGMANHGRWKSSDTRRCTTLRVLNGRSTFSRLVEYLPHVKVD